MVPIVPNINEGGLKSVVPRAQGWLALKGYAGRIAEFVRGACNEPLHLLWAVHKWRANGLRMTGAGLGTESDFRMGRFSRVVGAGGVKSW